MNTRGLNFGSLQSLDGDVVDCIPRHQELGLDYSKLPRSNNPWSPTACKKQSCQPWLLQSDHQWS